MAKIVVTAFWLRTELYMVSSTQLLSKKKIIIH